MLSVTIHMLIKGEDVAVGKILWDGHQVHAAPESEMLMEIATTPVRLEGRRIEPHKQPEEFLKALHLRYKSAYLRASQATGDSPSTKKEPPVNLDMHLPDADGTAFGFYIDSKGIGHGATAPSGWVGIEPGPRGGKRWRRAQAGGGPAPAEETPAGFTVDDKGIGHGPKAPYGWVRLDPGPDGVPRWREWGTVPAAPDQAAQAAPEKPPEKPPEQPAAVPKSQPWKDEPELRARYTAAAAEKLKAIAAFPHPDTTGMIKVLKDMQKVARDVKSRIDIVNRQIETEKRRERINESFVAARNKESEDLSKQLDQMKVQWDIEKKKLTDAEEESQERALPIFRLPQDKQLKINSNKDSGALWLFSDESLLQVSIGLNWLGQVFAKNIRPGGWATGMDPDAIDVTFVALSPLDDRAYHAKDSRGKEFIAIPFGVKPATIVHEVGHQLEGTNPAIHAAVEDFLKHRLGNEKPVKLNTIEPSYMNFEEGRKDEFDKAFPEGAMAYYVGKVTPDGTSEVVSMGLEKMYEDPVGFAKADPDYFSFISSIMDGTIR